MKIEREDKDKMKEEEIKLKQRINCLSMGILSTLLECARNNDAKRWFAGIRKPSKLTRELMEEMEKQRQDGIELRIQEKFLCLRCNKNEIASGDPGRGYPKHYMMPWGGIEVMIKGKPLCDECIEEVFDKITKALWEDKHEDTNQPNKDRA